VRPAAAGAVLGLAVALGAPAAWELTREPAAAGAPLEQALPVPAAPPVAEVPTVVARDAAPSAVPQRPSPVRVAVPGLGVHAPVEPVGVRDDGQMALPDDVDRLGWYRFGPAPGADGSAVLAGHVDDVTQGLGALAPLRDAEPGAEVVVTDAAGADTRWQVVSRETVAKQALPVDRLFARSGPPRVVLITCGGEFLPEVGGYESNVVVVAEPLL
jgi:sortase family protein